jgi:hypothetical protein
MIPRPLAWGIAGVMTVLEALNVVAAIWVDGYQSDALVHFAFTTIVGFMLGMREGGAVARTLTAFRTITNPPPGPPEPPPPQPGPQEPPP